MASQAVQKLAHMAESSRRALTNIRERTKLNERRAMSMGEVLVGAALAGVADRKLDKGEGHWVVAGVPATPVAGLVLAVLGLSGWVPGGEDVAHLGVGLLTGPLYTWTYNRAG